MCMARLAWAFRLVVAGCLCAALADRADAQVAPIIEGDASENYFTIKPDFDGSSVVVFGAVDRSRLNGRSFDVAVSVRGPAKSVTVWKKEHIGGIWINNRSRIFDAVPSFYACIGTRAVADMADRTERSQYELGMDVLNFVVESDAERAENKEGFLDALVQSKRKSALYKEQPGAIEFLGRSLFRAKVFIPPAGGAGLYAIKIFLIEDGRIVSSTVSHVRLEKAGIERFLSSTSLSDPWFYGLFAVLLAAAVGGGASLLFPKK